MAKRLGPALQALGSAAIIIAIILFANSYVLVFPVIRNADLIIVLLLEASFLLFASGSVAKYPQSGYRLARSTIVAFLWIYFLIAITEDYLAASGSSVPGYVFSYISNTLYYLPFFAGAIALVTFFVALAKKTPLKNKISGQAIIMGSFIILAYLPFLNSGMTYLDSLSTFVHELIYLAVPIVAVEAFFSRFKFHRDIPKLIIYGNMFMVPLYFNRSILFLFDNIPHPGRLLFPVAYLLLSFILLIISTDAVVYLFRGVGRPMAMKKVAGAIIPLLAGYFLLSYFGLIPYSFFSSRINPGLFLSVRFYFLLIIAIILMSLFMLAGKFIATKGGKGSVVFGTLLFLSVLDVYYSGYRGHFQIPLLVGMTVSAAVIGGSASLSTGLKNKFLGSYDLLKTTQVKKKAPVSKGTGGGTHPPTNPTSTPKVPAPSRSPNVPDFWINREISGYRVTDIISRETGFAYVLRAEKPGESQVAIKILKPFASDGTKIAFDNEFLRKFLLEFQNVMVLNGKKYVVNIIGVGLRTYPDDNTKMEKYKENPPAIIMELLQGGKLSDLDFKFNTMKQMELFFEIAIRVAQGLQDAHDARILHGDIKPDNVMFWSKSGKSVKSFSRMPERLIQAIRNDEIIPKIVDFGSAKIRGLGNIVFSQFSVLYSPPEILLNNYDTDETYDVYEFGMVMYYLLTGTANDFRNAKNYAKRQVFIESRVNTQKFYSDKNQLISDASAIPVTEPSKINPMIRKPLQFIVMRCIDPDPAKRYTDMSEIKKSLLHCAVNDYGFKNVRGA